MKPESDKQIRHYNFLKSILQKPLDSPDMLAHAILQSADLLLPCKAKRLWRYNRLEDVFVLQDSIPKITDREFSSVIPASEAISGKSTSNGEPKYYSDVNKSGLLKNKESIDQDQLDNLWVVPIILNSNDKELYVYGTLLLYPTESFDEADEIVLDEEDVFLMRELSELVLSHSPKLDRDRMASSIVLGKSTSESYSVFWDRIAKGISGELGYQSCSVFISDAVRGSVKRVGSIGVQISEEAKSAVVSVSPEVVIYTNGSSATGKVLAEGRTIHSQDVYQEPWCGEAFGTPDPNATYLATPIRHGPDGPVLGLLRCMRKYRKKPPHGADLVNDDDIVRIESLSKELLPIVQHYIHSEQNRVSFALASHDLRAPVKFINDAAGHIAKKEGMFDRHGNINMALPAKYVREIRDILDSTEVLHILIDALRGTADQEEEYDYERIDILPAFLAKVVHLLRPKTRGSEIRIEYDSDFEQFPRMWMDKKRMTIVLFNVVQNAIKYSRKRGVIRIWWNSSFESYNLNVSNDGIGVPLRDAKNIFLPYYRASNVVNSALPGRGLGLHIVQNILGRHGSSIEVTKLHLPTVFTLKYPKRLAYEKPSQ